MAHPPPSHQRVIGLLVLTAVLWSSSGLFVKVLDWPPLAILAGRSVPALVVFLLYLRSASGLRIRWTRWHLLGALGYTGAQLMFIPDHPDLQCG